MQPVRHSNQQKNVFHRVYSMFIDLIVGIDTDEVRNNYKDFINVVLWVHFNHHYFFFYLN